MLSPTSKKISSPTVSLTALNKEEPAHHHCAKMLKWKKFRFISFHVEVDKYRVLLVNIQEQNSYNQRQDYTG